MTNEKSKEEIAKQRETDRKTALGNLKDPFYRSFVSAFMSYGNDSYGKKIEQQVHNFVYLPAFNSDRGKQYVNDSIINSREDEELYSGTYNERQGIKQVYATLIDGLSKIKVQDILELSGSKAKVKDKFKDKYLFELANSNSEETQKLARTLFGGYMDSILDEGVMNSFVVKNQVRVGNLEKMLTDQPKEKK